LGVSKVSGGGSTCKKNQIKANTKSSQESEKKGAKREGGKKKNDNPLINLAKRHWERRDRETEKTSNRGGNSKVKFWKGFQKMKTEKRVWHRCQKRGIDESR